jgi:hypothetical protein
MFRNLLFGATALVLLCMPFAAHAGGTLSVQPNYHPRTNSFGGVVGLYIQEKITGPLTYDSWSGVGLDAAANEWNISNHNITYRLGRTSVSVGMGASFGRRFDTFSPNVHTRVAVQLW